MVICLLAPAQAMAADDQAQIEAAIRTAYQNGDDAALETAAGEFKTYLLSQHMTEQEVCNYLDNWFRTQVEGYFRSRGHQADGNVLFSVYRGS